MKLEWFAWLSVAWAFAGVLVLGLAQLLGLKLPEKWVHRGAMAHAIGLMLSTVAILAIWLPVRMPVSLHSAPLFHVHGVEWRATLLIDRLSVSGLVLLSLVYPPIIRFSIPSFHREPGAQRFWFLVALFALGLVLVMLAGNIDVFFMGWELVGVASVMLISFFRRNLRSAHNSLRALITYRLCDLGVLSAAVWMHHAFPSADFSHLVDDAVLPTSGLVAAAILFGSLAKSAQLPMSPWLHRAMEGPASSSAIFYGALSVHLGAFLLLRMAPLWLPHEGVRVAMGVIGLSTAVYATLVGRVRCDAKTALAYATMAMLGVIFVELSLGFTTLALAHVVAHAGLRTWQFLRSSSLIQDFQENPLVGADVLIRRNSHWEAIFPQAWRGPLYHAALRQFWLDEAHWFFVARPVVRFFQSLARAEQWLFSRRRKISPKSGIPFLPIILGLTALLSVASAPISPWSPGLSTSVLLGVCVVTALLMTGLGLARREPQAAISALVMSQAMLAASGAVLGETGWHAARLMLISMTLGALVLQSILIALKKKYGSLLLERDWGLAQREPLLHRLFVTMGWLMVGVPGGISFFAEDLLFHSIVEYSVVATMAFLLSTALNAVVFYRVYIGIFAGPGREEHQTSTPFAFSGWKPLALTAMVGVVLIGGLWPSLLL